MHPPTPRGALLWATLLSTLAGVSVFAWQTWWVWWGDTWPFALVAVLVLTLLVVAPVSVGLCAVRSSCAGPRLTAVRSGRLAAAFVVPAALVVAVSTAWPYVLTPSVRALLENDMGAAQANAFIAAAPSPVAVGVAAFAALLVAGAAAWSVIFTLALVLRRASAQQRAEKSPRPEAEGLRA